MATRMLIDATHPEETRVVVIRGNRLEEFDFETSTKRPLKGNIYLAKVTRVEPALQAAFVEYGGNRHGFLAFGEIHPDYYQIPVADRQKLLEMQAEEEARAQAEADADADAAANLVGESDAAPDLTSHIVEVDGGAAEVEDIHRPMSAAAEQPVDQIESPFPAETLDAAGSNDIPPINYADAAPVSAWSDQPEPLSAAPDSLGDADLQITGDAAVNLEVFENPAEEGGDEEADADTDTDSDADTESPRASAKRRRQYLRAYKIQEVIKRRQIMLVQVVKEERGNKGAALTTYLSLAGRYCVLMPNSSRGGGISRKIANPSDRKRLKEIVSNLEVPGGMGVILRTAGLDRDLADIKRDFDYLLRLWDSVRDYTFKSEAPCLVYEEGSLIKRAIRDYYSSEIEEILVEGSDAHKTAADFMQMIMPGHVDRVRLYRDPVHLFQRYQVEQQFDSMYSPTVQLRSGGYIVINPAEALVAIDVNSGKSTREHNIEETAYKTNLEAAEEIARQLRLRDLAGLIVIDFIDMEDGRNNRNVERRLKECLKVDRARIQVGRISPFGLLEMSRQRLRPSLLESSTTLCPHCSGLGYVRSTESTALYVLRAIEEAAIRDKAAELTVHVATSVAMYILNMKRTALQAIEERCQVRVLFQGDDALVPPNHKIERSRNKLSAAQHTGARAAVSAETVRPIEIEAEMEEREEDIDLPAMDTDGTDRSDPMGEKGRGRRRRRRRRNGERVDYTPTSDMAVGGNDGLETTEEPSIGEKALEAEDFSPSAEELKSGADEGQHQRRRRGRRGGRYRNRRPSDNGAPTSSDQTGMSPSEAMSRQGSFLDEGGPMTSSDDRSPATIPEPPASHDRQEATGSVSAEASPAAEKPRRFGWWRRSK